MKFTTGMTSVTFREKSIEEITVLAKRAKLSEIEWGADRHVLPSDAEAIKNARFQMYKNELRCSSYGSYYRIGDRDEDSFRAICRTAQALGAGMVRVWLGKTGSEKTTDDLRTQMLEEVKHLASVAEKYGQILAFEFHGKTLNDNGESSVSFLSECKKENIKTYWQPLSYSDNEKNLSLVLPYLSAVHVFTWDDAHCRYPLADGSDAWKKYLKILKDANVSTKLIMEFVKDDSALQFLSDAAVLHEWIQSI
ncbi:MAG: sugar phosphate isomerase/epimerase [Clostridia bacterium]|nr:sugar phosphate isomerase/epimerase [Clostridia bacterium]